MFKHMLIPLDGSPLAECVLPHAMALAQAFEAKVTLLRVLVCPTGTAQIGHSIDPLEWRLCKAEAEAYVTAIAARLAEEGFKSDCIVLEGQPASQILNYVRGHDIDLLALSSHGQSGLSGWNLSSVVQKVLARVHTSVLIVRAYQPQPEALQQMTYTRLLVPLDGSQRAEYPLGAARTLAKQNAARLILTHVVHRPELFRRSQSDEVGAILAEQIVEHNRLAAAAYLEQVRIHLDSDVQTEVKTLFSEDVAIRLHTLVDEENVDLVIMCAHGYSGSNKWPYGSVATSFIHYGFAPLLIVQDFSPHEVIQTHAELASQEQPGHGERLPPPGR